jgi:hypothetical protein
MKLTRGMARSIDVQRMDVGAADWSLLGEEAVVPVPGRGGFGTPELRMWHAVVEQAFTTARRIGRGMPPESSRDCRPSEKRLAIVRAASELRDWMHGNYVGSLEWIMEQFSADLGIDLSAERVVNRIERLISGNKEPRTHRTAAGIGIHRIGSRVAA